MGKSEIKILKSSKRKEEIDQQIELKKYMKKMGLNCLKNLQVYFQSYDTKM